jgi:hypothetical protein
LASSQGCRDGSIYPNHYMEYSTLIEAKTKTTDHLNRYRKTPDEIQEHFMTKDLRKLGIEGM